MDRGIRAERPTLSSYRVKAGLSWFTRRGGQGNHRLAVLWSRWLERSIQNRVAAQARATLFGLVLESITGQARELQGWEHNEGSFVRVEESGGHGEVNPVLNNVCGRCQSDVVPVT